MNRNNHTKTRYQIQGNRGQWRSENERRVCFAFFAFVFGEKSPGISTPTQTQGQQRGSNNGHQEQAPESR